MSRAYNEQGRESNKERVDHRVGWCSSVTGRETALDPQLVESHHGEVLYRSQTDKNEAIKNTK